MPADRTIDAAEIEQFDADADRWWDSDGPFAPLHRLNPVRLRYIRDRACAHFGREIGAGALEGLAVIDVGCGGGLLCEPLVRLGADVTGVDAGESNIRVAADHAAAMGLAIDYRVGSAADIADDARFDIVISVEVIEHVPDPETFTTELCRLVAPGGLLIMATLNRTAKSYALAIVGAEYLLRWLPRGTHRWDRFVRPSELARMLRANAFRVTDISGVGYQTATGDWILTSDPSVNYMLAAARA